MGKKIKKIIAASITATAAAGTVIAVKKQREKQLLYHEQSMIEEINKRDYKDMQVYFAGGGLASLSGAVYLIRDCHFKGENIHILGGIDRIDEKGDEIELSNNSFPFKGKHIFFKETSENFWELFSYIPSLTYPDKSVTEEMLSNCQHHSLTKPCLIDRDGKVTDKLRKDFSPLIKKALGKLLTSKDSKLGQSTIRDWFKETPSFFDTNFWYVWQTSFGFQKWSSLILFRRSLLRMIPLFCKGNPLEGAIPIPVDPYILFIKPLFAYLEKHNVNIYPTYAVTDIDFDKNKLLPSALHVTCPEKDDYIIPLREKDLCIIENGSIASSSRTGSLKTKASSSFSDGKELWKNIAGKKQGLGNPEPFFHNREQTHKISFHISCKGEHFQKLLEKKCGNGPGKGAYIILKDSNWLMSIFATPYSHKEQDREERIFWGYGQYIDRLGDYVQKPMKECTGEEIMAELIHQLHFEKEEAVIMGSIIEVTPYYIPYAYSSLLPGHPFDRPNIIPEQSQRLAFIGPFTNIPEDVPCLEEYSVRSGRMAIYHLLNIDMGICPVTSHHKDPKIVIDVLKKFCT